MPPVGPQTGLSITNPLVLYRALLATKRIDPDPAQHRLALHLQKLYERLKDYEPVVQYGHRLQQLSRALGSSPGRPSPGTGHEQPRGGTPSEGILASFLRTEPRASKEGMALTKVLTSHEAAMALDSPKGLMLHGEVGTGKSMLIDLFADCLPNRKKARWHYTSFMLHTLHKLEQLRRSRQLVVPASLGQGDDYSLLWLARDMISTSPILFLDEFQLPDRAAAKIMTNLMTCFFHLGGVLVATSNRMPEELAKAAGLDFAQPAPNRLEALKWSFGLSGGRPAQGRKSDFAQFLDVLRARCEVWEMESQQDYRRREAESDAAAAAAAVTDSTAVDGLADAEPIVAEEAASDTASVSGALPKYFFVKPTDATDTESLRSYESGLSNAITSAASSPSLAAIPWGSTALSVYGRSVAVPRHHAGVTYWTFDELCGTTLGPADYITLASTFHTLVLTDVPVLSLLQKNEARRLITLLDALYEARCKLIVSAAAGPDDIFFPEANRPAREGDETVTQDQILPETFAEIYQDATAPFRPNVSSYTDGASAAADPGIAAPEEPDATHARFAGMLADEGHGHGVATPRADQLEDMPPHSMTSRQGIGPAAASRQALDTGDGMQHLHDPLSFSPARGSGPDFQRAGIFTGEDERFAYKRARSRLWEMCGGRWWARSADGDAASSNAETEAPAERVEAEHLAPSTPWWRPQPSSSRPWEKPARAPPAEYAVPDALASAAAEAAFARRQASTSVLGADGAAGEGTRGERALSSDADAVLFQRGNASASPYVGGKAPPGPPEGFPKVSSEGLPGRKTAEKPTLSTAPSSAAPSFSLQHFWGTTRWGRKAGRWGMGAEVFEESSSPEKEAVRRDMAHGVSGVRERPGSQDGDQSEKEEDGKGEDTTEAYVQRRAMWRKKEFKNPLTMGMDDEKKS